MSRVSQGELGVLKAPHELHTENPPGYVARSLLEPSSIAAVHLRVIATLAYK